MEAVKFKGHNTIYAKNQPQYHQLPALVDKGQILSCWEMGWKERLNALLFGKIWLCILGNTQPPVWMVASKNEVQFEEGSDT